MPSSTGQLTPSGAKALVKQIAKGHGHLSEEVYARMDLDTRRAVQEMALTKDKIISSATIT